MGSSCSSKSSSDSYYSPACYCIDGRETTPCFGSPGGDAGIILRVVYAYYLVKGKELSLDELKKLIVESSIILSRPIYFHSDSHAKEHIDLTSEVKNIDDLYKPENIGCGYFKLAMTNQTKLNEEEGANLSKIARNVYLAVCSTLWAEKARINFVVLKGDHKEDAVKVSKSTTETLDPEGHIFVYHPTKESNDTKKVIEALAHMVNVGDDEENIYKKALEINDRHWKGAIDVLAPGIEHQMIE